MIPDIAPLNAGCARRMLSALDRARMIRIERCAMTGEVRCNGRTR